MRLLEHAVSGGVNSGVIPVGFCGSGLSTILSITADILKVHRDHIKGGDA